MKFTIKALAAAVALAVTGVAQALPVNGPEEGGAQGADVLVNILGMNADFTHGESMVINTGITSDQFFPGSTFTWTSDSALTSAISDFISGYDKARFYAGGAVVDGFIDKTALNTGNPLASTSVGGFTQSMQVFRDQADDLTASPTNWAIVPVGDAEHFKNPQLTYAMNTGVGLDESVAFAYSSVTWGPAVQATLNDWSLSSAGVLTYNATTTSDFCWECLPSRGGWRAALP